MIVKVLKQTGFAPDGKNPEIYRVGEIWQIPDSFAYMCDEPYNYFERLPDDYKVKDQEASDADQEPSKTEEEGGVKRAVVDEAPETKPDEEMSETPNPKPRRSRRRKPSASVKKKDT